MMDKYDAEPSQGARGVGMRSAKHGIKSTMSPV